MSGRKPIVAIVGRPNVGKSTLFNRILGSRTAIVEDTSGITRDRNYGEATYNGHSFLVVDTGGIFSSHPEEEMAREIRRQAMLAVEEADLILFMLDARDGITPPDRELSDELRKTKCPILHVVNKVDGPAQEASTPEFFALAPEELVTVSALHGRGIEELLDRIVEIVPYIPAEEDDSKKKPGIAVVGKPNSGKSTLINALIGKERMIASPVAGTTRDSIDTECTYHGRPYLLIDTAGLRKKSKIEDQVEYYSMLRTLQGIDRADVALILTDAQEGFTEQDQKIAGLVHEAGKGCIILINKWDLAEEKSDHALREKIREIKSSAWFLAHAPVLSVSALTHQRITKVFPIVDKIVEERRKRIPTARLNAFVSQVRSEQTPPKHAGRDVKILYMTQVHGSPPGFALFVNKPDAMAPSYLRFVERRLRETFGFEGTPVRFYLKKREERKKKT